MYELHDLAAAGAEMSLKFNQEPGKSGSLVRQKRARKNLVWTSFLATVLAFGGAVAAEAQTPLPAIDPIRGILNGASFLIGQPVAPGSFVAIFGTNFASGPAVFDSIPFPNTMAGVSVGVNGIPAPVISVNSTQINVQLPWSLPTSGSVPLVVQTPAGQSQPATVFLTTAAPGLFYMFTDSTGVDRPGVYNNADGSLPFPANIQVPRYFSRPARPGDTLIIPCTGLGAVTNTPADGAPGMGQDPFSTTMTQPVVLVGGVPASVLFSGLSPQYPSVYQIAISVPAVQPGNAVPLQLQMNGVTTTDQLFIAIGQ